MNKTHDGTNYGMTQYRWPLDFELAGRAFTLRSDEAVYELAFQDREFVECNGVLSQYEALKLDAEMHAVFFGETITNNPSNGWLGMQKFLDSNIRRTETK